MQNLPNLSAHIHLSHSLSILHSLHSILNLSLPINSKPTYSTLFLVSPFLSAPVWTPTVRVDDILGGGSFAKISHWSLCDARVGGTL